MEVDEQPGLAAAPPGAGPQRSDLDKDEHLLRKAETVLKYRTDKVVLVLERVLDNTNFLGALRTAEILGAWALLN